jgi:hypothetical protein
MNAGFWIKFYPLPLFINASPLRQRESKLGPASGQLGARLEANNESFEAFCCFRLVCGS